ncbi:MAG: hypothetical protein U0V74_00230 [Chitinophagales bacterium]
MKKRHLQYLLLVALVICAGAVFAQGGPPPPPPPPAPPPPNTPIDGGVFLMLAAGLAYGAKKLYSKDV